MLAANDGLANSVISVLKNNQIPAKKVPTTGQDATSQGLQNVLDDYQCMTVYKPIYVEAQAAVAVALYLRAGKTAAEEPRQRQDEQQEDQRAVDPPDADHRDDGEHERRRS